MVFEKQRSITGKTKEQKKGTKQRHWCLIIIGCDPGRYGAIAILTNGGVFVAVHDLPILVYQMSQKGKPQWRLNALAFYDMLETAMVTSILQNQELTVALEFAFGQPANGSVGNRQTGMILGGLSSVLDLMDEVTVEYLLPQTWQKHFGLIGENRGKQGSLTLARQFFPEAPLARQKDHNRADALLIAQYAKEVHR